jgi:thiol:disulfide interchange protein
LLGVFEVGNLLPNKLLNSQAQHPALDALLSGVLAVVAASPCTAPFMGAALGYALTLDTLSALSIFLALGLGMALPYVLLAYFPNWLKRLPEPGAWMLTLKHALAYPMFATVVWLLWVLGQQSGIDAVAQILLAFIGLAALLQWLAKTASTAIKLALALACVGLSAWAWPVLLPPSAVKQQALSKDWAPFDAALIAQSTASGQAVFVDFTAAWCVSCQANKRLVLHTDTATQAFANKKVLRMQADWTHADPKITQALQALGRSGVPVYVLHRPGKAPLLLPEILTQGILQVALSTL